MISFDEAVELVRRAAHPLAQHKVALEGAAGHVLAKPVIARLPSPRADVSAMDGYAVRDADIDVLPARLKIVGESFAGRGWKGESGRGECVRTFTGAPVPRGADRVVIQENVRREGDVAIVDEHPGSARHIRMRGGDFETGDELLASGRLLDPRAIVTAAAADVPELEVFTRPRIHILSTGDELAAPGTASVRADAIPESVSFGVAALARQWGAAVTGRTRLSDDLPAMEKAAADALGQADVIVVTGGASVGEKDFAKAMFDPVGLELVFSKVAIKPGKPVWLGRAENTLIVGLPGNPTSAMVTGRLLLAPLIAGLAGRSIDEALRWRSIPLASGLKECGSRETFHRARWSGNAVDVLSNQDSSAQKVLAEADLLVRQRADSAALQAGDSIDALEF